METALTDLPATWAIPTEAEARAQRTLQHPPVPVTLADFVQRGSEPPFFAEALNGLLPHGFVYRLTNPHTTPPQVYVGLAASREQGEAGWLSRRMHEHTRGIRNATQGKDCQHVHRRLAETLRDEQGTLDYHAVQVEVLDICWEQDPAKGRLQLGLMEMYYIAQANSFGGKTTDCEGLNRTPGGEGTGCFTAESRIEGSLKASRTKAKQAGKAADQGLLATYIVLIGQLARDDSMADALRAVGVEAINAKNKKEDSPHLRMYDSKITEIRQGKLWGGAAGFVAGLAPPEQQELRYGIQVLVAARQDPQSWSLARKELLADPLVQANPTLNRLVQTAHGIEHAHYRKDLAAIEDYLALNKDGAKALPTPDGEQWRKANAKERIGLVLRSLSALLQAEFAHATRDGWSLTCNETGRWCAQTATRTFNQKELELLTGQPLAPASRPEVVALVAPYGNMSCLARRARPGR